MSEEASLMTTLVLAQTEATRLLPGTARLVGAARAFGRPVTVLVAGYGMGEAAARAARLEGVERVLLADDACLAEQLAEPMAALLRPLSAEYDVIIGGMASMAHREILPRLAGMLDVMALSDVLAIENESTFQRPAFAGNVVTTVRLLDDGPRLLLMRESAFEEAGADGARSAPVEKLAVPADLPLPVRVIAEERHGEGGPDLRSARLVLGMGRGASGEEARRMLHELADRLNAAIAATRAVVDDGLAPNEWQVGQTGKRIAPAVYVAFGISGAHQHLAGIRDAGLIVAVNTDEEAPIFRAADHGLVMDATEVLRRLLEEASAPKRA